MDSLLSLHTPNTFPHAPPPQTQPQHQPQPPGIHIAATSSATTATATATTPAGASIPNFLVPKLEPLDDFVDNQEPQWPLHQHPQQYQQLLQQQQQQQQHPPFLEGHAEDEEETDLYSDYYRLSHLFRVAFAKSREQRYGCVMPDPNSPPFGDVQVSTPNLHLGDFNVSGPDSQVLGDLSVPPPNSQQQPGIEAAACDAAVSDPNSRAIVPAPQQDPSAMAVAVTPRRNHKHHKLRKELVRVTDLGMKDQLHYRGIVRRTRMIYDSLRVLTSVEEEKRAIAAVAALAAASAAGAPAGEGAEGGGSISPRVPRRLRGDLRAASLMRERDLWLNRDKRIVGAIPGVYVGDLFLFRMELCVLGLHGQIQAGIDYLPGSMSSNGEPIATSVIVSGGYEDDLDDGEVIVYTGQGGQEKNSSRQASHQKMEGGNLALERSMHYGIEVRVIRGVRYEGSASSSGKVYVYDGLYRIVDCWFDVGKSGFGVFKYKLWRIEGQPRMGSAILKDARDIRRNGFDFKPMYCLSVDISNRKENVPVRLFNDIDDNQDPLCYEYLARTTFPQLVFHQTGRTTGCDCVDGCGDGCFCCMKNGGEFPYNQQGILVRGKPLIFECGPFCSCPPHCRSRVTQKGLKNRLEVFRSEQTGWGVRSLDIIHAGAFICEFTGVVLTREQAQILTMNGDSSIYPNRFSERWAEWGDLSQIYSNYVRPSYPSVPPLDFSLDVSTMRNVACYMSHSSTPNVMVQYVLYDHNNLMFPHVMLFAMENIPPLRELSLDYGVADEWTGKLSICN